MNLSLLGATFFENYGLLIILIVFLGVMFFINFKKNKKYQEKANELVSKIVPGAKVKTYSGFYGTVVKITETTEGNVVLLNIGLPDAPSYIEIDINAIYGIDEKELMSDFNARVAKEEKEEAERLAKEQAELEKAQAKAEVVEEVKEEKTETTPKKKTTKKTK